MGIRNGSNNITDCMRSHDGSNDTMQCLPPLFLALQYLPLNWALRRLQFFFKTYWNLKLSLNASQYRTLEGS
jgi:hypothetical protein